jgi:hypothetical protein
MDTRGTMDRTRFRRLLLARFAAWTAMFRDGFIARGTSYFRCVPDAMR